jgi:signal transduction histidine kinase
MKRLWPRRLSGQMIALVLIGLGLAQVFSFVIYRVQHQSTLRSIRDQHVLARIASVGRLLVDTPPALHDRIVRAASSPLLRLTLNGKPVLETSPPSRRGLLLRQELARLMDVDPINIRIGVRESTRHSHSDRHEEDEDEHDDEHDLRRRARHGKQASVLVVAVRLDDGQWLNAIGGSRPSDPFWEWSTLLSVGLSALILSLLMIGMVRRITFPLARLAAAADRFGRGEAQPALPERGPADIQHTIRAFNQMQTRLERFVQDRTHMLAAISHDLRTPITALRVRAELIEDSETRKRILGTLDEMQHMTEATLAFVREEAAQEETRLIDIDALVESVCDDLSDMGKEVSFSGPGKTPYRCRSVSLKRALGNLIDNAVSYGQQVHVTLTTEREALCIVMDDEGPGIAEADMERVFEPFVRLETSRSLETGGVGLGMAIARSIVRQHGGDITLTNREEGGLRTTVLLPSEGAPHVNG